MVGLFKRKSCHTGLCGCVDGGDRYSQFVKEYSGGVRESRPVLAFVGNPNAGKTSLFNFLTGLRQKVANFPGVTVEKKVGVFFSTHGREIEILDLPGIYSLHTQSLDENVARSVVLGRGGEQVDGVVFVADVMKLQRNLYFCSQLIELGVPVMLVVNKIDQAKKNSLQVDIGKLSKKLGIPVVGTQALDRKDLHKLRVVLTHFAEGRFMERRGEKLSGFMSERKMIDGVKVPEHFGSESGYVSVKRNDSIGGSGFAGKNFCKADLPVLQDSLVKWSNLLRDEGVEYPEGVALLTLGGGCMHALL